MNNINMFLSQKIKIISFVCIIMVLYIHSDFHEVEGEILGMNINILCQKIISKKIARCAVPLFFSISGFLFFSKMDYGLKSVWLKMKKRFRSLFIPYVIGCITYVLFILLLECIPSVSKYINDHTIINCFDSLRLDVLKYVFFAAPESGQPWAFHLWFLRDLIIIVLFSPLLFVFRKYKIFLFSYFAVIFLLRCNYIFLPSIYISLFWFLLGSVFLNKIELSRNSTIILLFIYILCLFSEVYYEPFFLGKIDLVLKIIGCVLVWNLYDLFIPAKFDLKEHRLLCAITEFTFFIYVFHEPYFNIIRKGMIMIVGKTELGFLLTYLTSPWICAVFLISCGYLLRKKHSRFYRICVGGR